MKREFRQQWLTLLLCLMILPVRAGSLKCISDHGENLPLPAFNASPPLKIAARVPAGKPLFSQRYSFSIWCSISDPQQQQPERLWLFRRTSNATLSNGLTLFTTLNGDRNSEPAALDSGITVDNHAAAAGRPPQEWQRITIPLLLEVVKTASTPSATAQAQPVSPQITLLEVGSQSGGQRLKLLLPGADRWLTFVTQSCQVRGSAMQTVTLGRVSLRSLRGRGTTSDEKAFSLDLFCDPQLAGQTDIMLRLDGASPHDVPAAGLFALSAQSHAAQGIALQLLHGDSRLPVIPGEAWQIARYPMIRGDISVPLIARYYQYASQITAGRADATLTWTLSYL